MFDIKFAIVSICQSQISINSLESESEPTKLSQTSPWQVLAKLAKDLILVTIQLDTEILCTKHQAVNPRLGS